MMRQVCVYRISKGWKIFIIISVPFIIVFFGVGAITLPFWMEKSDEIGIVVVCFLSGVGIIVFSLYGLLSGLKERIEIYPDRIKYIGLFRTIELLLEEISGFRILPTPYAPTVLLLPKNPTTRKLKLELNVERRDELLEWLNRNLEDLDTRHFQEEMTHILHNMRLDDTEKHRLRVIGNAKRWAKILNSLGLIAMLWGMFWPQPYFYTLWALILFPFVVLGAVHYFGGALKFDSSKQSSAFPTIFPGLLAPCMGLGLRVFSDFNILNWKICWVLWATCSLFVYILALLLTNKDARQRVSDEILLVIFCIVYGFSTVIALNSMWDRSAPSVYEAQIFEKWGCKNQYTLTLSPWGQRAEENDIDVGKSVYERYEIGNWVDVVVRHGGLGIPWFYVQ
jgi:hypothetical protein